MPVFVYYLIPLVLGVGLLVLGGVKPRGGLKRVSRRKTHDSTFAKFWMGVIESTGFLKNYIRKVINKVDIINGFDPSNSLKVSGYFGLYVIGSVVLFSLISLVTVTIAVFLTFVMGYIIISVALVDIVLGIKLEKIQGSFKDSLDAVIDSYLQTGNFQVALQNSISGLPSNIRPLYQKLLREYLGSPNPDKALYDFAASLDYVYSYAFVELISLSTKVKSIDKELIFLNKAMSSNMLEDKEEKGSFGTITTLYGIIMVFVGIGFVATLAINPVAKDLYFNTLKGNYVLMFWIFGNIAGLGVIAAIRKS